MVHIVTFYTPVNYWKTRKPTCSQKNDEDTNQCNYRKTGSCQYVYERLVFLTFCIIQFNLFPQRFKLTCVRIVLLLFLNPWTILLNSAIKFPQQCAEYHLIYLNVHISRHYLGTNAFKKSLESYTINIYILIGERIPAIPAPHALQGPVLSHHVSVCVCCRYGSVILRVWPCFLVAVVRLASHVVRKKKKKNPRCKPRPSFSSVPHRCRRGNNGAGLVIGDPAGASLSVCRYRTCWAPVLLPLLTLALCSICLSCGTAFLAVHLGFHCRRPSFLPSFRLLWLYLRSGAPVPWLLLLLLSCYLISFSSSTAYLLTAASSLHLPWRQHQRMRRQSRLAAVYLDAPVGLAGGYVQDLGWTWSDGVISHGSSSRGCSGPPCRRQRARMWQSAFLCGRMFLAPRRAPLQDSRTFIECVQLYCCYCSFQSYWKDARRQWTS
jgi:hypothetical protein